VASLKRADLTTYRRTSRLLLALALISVALLVVTCTRAAIWVVDARMGPTTYGPGSGTLTGIIRPCTPADLGSGVVKNSRIVTAYAQNLAGRTVASQRLPHRRRGVRYRFRLLAGSYTINALASGPEADSQGVVVIVTAHRKTTVNVSGGNGCV
jgi:hypothetical protein